MSSTFAAGLNSILLYASTLMLLCACSSPSQRFDEQAYASGLVRTEIDGSPFGHAVYARSFAPERSGDLMVVFIDGDGSPWIEHGTRIASDPTPRQPLALRLMLGTSLPAWYLARPCYNGMTDGHCTAALWTNARYSRAVVDSMVAALQNHSRAQSNRRILLVGYSGGGVLARLMAPRLEGIVGVVTIAANLDTAAWTALHGYLPLDESLNPAEEPPHIDAPVIHLVGEKDTNTPTAALARYLESHPGEQVWRYSEFDHVCCWVDRWPEILVRILKDMQPDAAPSSPSSQRH